MSPAPTNAALQGQIEDISEKLMELSAGGDRRDKHLTELQSDIAEIKAVLKRFDDALFVPQPGQDKSFFYQASAMVADRVALGRVAKFFIWVVGALAALGITITLRMQDK